MSDAKDRLSELSIDRTLEERPFLQVGQVIHDYRDLNSGNLIEVAACYGIPEGDDRRIQLRIIQVSGDGLEIRQGCLDLGKGGRPRRGIR